MPIHVLHLFGRDIRTWALVGELPFLLFIIALYMGGRRQGWSWRAALLATAAFVAGLGLGTACLPSVLGAAAGGIIFWFVAQRALGLRRPPLTVMALGLMALIAVGRWGCLLNGCCFGTITDLPWGMRFAAGSSPYFLHESLGLLGHGAVQSLPVHPYPAYESLGLALWLPVAWWLSRRLRSKGALLAWSAAFDLGLRGAIDGTRAMVNVWWSLLGAWHGLNLFQWVLLAAASASFLLGALFEYRARRKLESREALGAVAEAATPESHRLWLVYLGLVALGWLGDVGQTAFVHRALLLALAACVPALAIPRELGLRLHARGGFGYAVAATLVVVLGIRFETRARALEYDGNAAAIGGGAGRHRAWLYDVDQRRGVMVRVGSDDESDGTLAHREHMLGLPSLAVRTKRLVLEESSTPNHMSLDQVQQVPQVPSTPAASPPAPAVRRAHTWIGLGSHGGIYSSSDTVRTADTSTSSSTDSCSGTNYTTTTTTKQRNALGGWAQVEEEIPYASKGVFWIGGRVGAGQEARHDQVESSNPSIANSESSASYSAYYLNLWGEYETPEMAFGLGALGDYSPQQGTILFPGFHLRVGIQRIGLDAGFADRMSFLNQQNGHLGVSTTFNHVVQVPSREPAAARLFLGAFFFPGADFHRYDIAPGCAAEFFVTPRVVVGLNGALWTNQAFGGLHLRAVVGP